MKLLTPLFLSLFCAPLAWAQVNVPVNGPHDKSRPVEAFVHATVHPSPGEVWKDATLLIQGDRILAVGTDIPVPPGAILHDLTGLHLWPALIDPYSDLGVSAEKDKVEEARGAHYWNAAIRASRSAAEACRPDEERAAKAREQGFGLVITHRMDGIMRGSAAAVLLAGRNAQEDVLVPEVSQQFSLRKGSSSDPYPSSLTGCIALFRQAMYDARWYVASGRQQQSDVDLEALMVGATLPQVFEAANRNDVLRISGLGKEFARSFIVKGNGDEYMRLGEITATGQSLILPLTLPEAFDVEDPFEAMEVTLQQMKHWELAPYNAGRLHAAGVLFAFTLQGLKDPGDLWSGLRRMVQCGLDSTTAIAALTTVPAGLFGIADQCGTLAPGKLASFLITSDHLLADKNTIYETWVAGRRFVNKPLAADDLRGLYDLNLRSAILKLRVKGEGDKAEASVYRQELDSVKVKAELTRQGDLITLVFDASKLGISGLVRLNGIAHRDGGLWDGQGQMPGGEWIAWTAVRQARADRSNAAEKGEVIEIPDSASRAGNGKPEDKGTLDSLWSAAPGEVWVPFGAYGSTAVPDSVTVVFRHATVWTNGTEGILRDADVLVVQGKIKAVGRNLDVNAQFTEKKKPAVQEIDATGKHLTSGIIDEHAHIAIERGVNEGGQAISAEVRMGDVIDPDDVNIYRDLAGGVTAIQQLHGSANPIGGHSSLIKLRWGGSAEEMRIAGAPGFIKFALGENVKQSGSESSTRFPRTRMGVEQIMFDAFHRAREYDREQRAWQAEDQTSRNVKKYALGKFAFTPPRRDMELDALVEILNGTRAITCHSYVQSEILMLMRLADSLGFKVNTFTHILEGYKVAEKMKEHDVSASTFSDWWAYKFEVYDAIPYNAALLHDAGVNVCINSDDAEMSRRLNQEAAKAVKYGGVSEEEAWKMVTLNAAKALRLEHRMGSVEAGKDADLALWSANPLSIEAKCEMTLVDGVRRFDAQRDRELREAMRVERERLVAKMLTAKRAGAPVSKAARRERRLYECETIGE